MNYNFFIALALSSALGFFIDRSYYASLVSPIITLITYWVQGIGSGQKIQEFIEDEIALPEEKRKAKRRRSLILNSVFIFVIILTSFSFDDKSSAYVGMHIDWHFCALSIGTILAVVNFRLKVRQGVQLKIQK